MVIETGFRRSAPSTPSPRRWAPSPDTDRRFLSSLSHQTRGLRATWPPLVLLVMALSVAVFVPVWPLRLLAALGVFVLSFDVRARFMDYRRIRVRIARSGALIGAARTQLRSSSTSWCTRRAAIAAAYAEGLGHEAHALVKQWGYRPWHVFPDGAFTTHSPFLRISFWKSVLGHR